MTEVYGEPIACGATESLTDVYSGESINEDKIVIRFEEPKGLSVESFSAEKNGIVARLFAAKAVTSGRAGLILS